MKKNIALVLSGGGFKGYFQHAAIGVLRQAGIGFNYVNGVSIGSINGVFQAMNKHGRADYFWNRVQDEGAGLATTSDYLNFEDGMISPNTDAILSKLVPKLTLLEKIRLATPKGRKAVIKRILDNAKGIKGIADNTPLLNLLRQEVDRTLINVPFECGAVSLQTGAYLSLNPGQFADKENFVRYILASSNMPIVWPPVDGVKTIDGVTHNGLVDGGLRNISPLGQTASYIHEHPDDASQWLVIVINCGTGYVTHSDADLNILSIANRSLNDIALSQVFQGNMNETIRINQLVRQSDKPLYSESGRRLRGLDLMIIQPDDDSIGDTLDASAGIMRKRAKLGSEKALAALDWARKQQMI
ncbi:hypothetical protein GCM10027299_09360 [Larkinella ripae]